MSGRCRWSLLGTALLVAGCCGSYQRDIGDLKLPEVTKELDRTHEAIVSRHEGKLYAGAALVDITTDYGRNSQVYLGGFDAGRMNQGVRDPVYAHALFLDDGREPLVIVTLDVIGMMNNDICEIRALASDRHRDRIIIASTHDHVGPDTVGYWGPAVFGVLPMCPGTVPEYMATIKGLIGQAIDQAAANAKPAKLRFGTSMADPGLSLNIHAQIRKQKDDLVRVMAVDDAADGKPIAVLANWGCHAESLWSDVQMSADWPGVFYRRWQAEVGGVPVFIEGALGGLVSVNPGDDKMAAEKDIDGVFDHRMTMEDKLALRERMGNGLTDAVLAANRAAAEAYGPDGVTMTVASQSFDIEEDNWVFQYMGNRGIIKRKVLVKNGHYFLSTDIIAARLRAGDRVLADLTTVPGEPAPTVVEDLDATSSAPIKFNVALGNDEVGYMVREADWESDAYEYERTMSLGKPTATVVVGVVKTLRGKL